MGDYGKRFLIVMILAMCIGLLFIGGKTGHAATLGKTVSREDWVWPADGILSDGFGTRDGTHKGIDIAAELNTDIVAADEGVISKSYYSNSYGNVVFIKHYNGFETIYAHLNKRLVSEGKRVQQGEVIGKMGNTGRSRGVHLHFELHKDKWTVDKRHAINPLLALNRTSIDGNHLAQFTKDRGQAINVTKQMETAPKQETGIHVVKKGETLWSIAAMHQMTMASIKELNSLSGEAITPAQKLIIENKVKTHVIKRGETLYTIARKNGTSEQAIRKLNHLKEDTIKIGESLILHE
jgi:LysM repeat protein